MVCLLFALSEPAKRNNFALSADAIIVTISTLSSPTIGPDIANTSFRQQAKSQPDEAQFAIRAVDPHVLARNGTRKGRLEEEAIAAITRAGSEPRA